MTITLSKMEQETLIRGSAFDKTWEVVTADPKIIRKMTKQGYTQNEATNPWGYVSYTIPYGKVRIGKAVSTRTSFRLPKPTVFAETLESTPEK